MKVQKLLFLSFTILTVFWQVPQAHSAESCQVVYSEKSSKASFRKGKTEYDTFRSNANDFWAWSHQHVQSYLSKNLLTEGLIAGDPHAMNFGDLYLSGQKTKITLVDLDDSGHGVFLIDFARLLISIKMSSSELKTKKIWKSYLKGLRQESLDDIPRFIEKVMDKTRGDWLSEQEDFIANKTKNGKLDKEELDLKPLSQLNKKDLARAKLLIAKVGSVLPGAVVKDSAFKVKEDGGSQGLLRVWVLVEQNGKLGINEFKEMAPPATQYFENQKEQQARLQEITKMFWGVENPAEYKVVSIDGDNFWLRPRYKYSLKFNADKIDSDKKFERYEEWNEFIAYLLGRLHGKQPQAKALRATLQEKDLDAVIEKIKDFSKDYRAHLDELSHQKN